MIYRLVNGKVTGIDVQEEMLNGISWWIRVELVRDVNWESLLRGSIKGAGGDEDLDSDVILQEIADSMMPTEERGGARTGMRNLHSQIWRDLMSKPFLLDADEARKVVGGRAFGYMAHEADTDALVAKYIPLVRKHYGGRIAQFISQVMKNSIRDIVRGKRGKGTEVSLEGLEEKHGLRPSSELSEGKVEEWGPELGEMSEEEVKEVEELLPVTGWDDEEYKELLGVVSKEALGIIERSSGPLKHIYGAIYRGKFSAETATSDEEIRKEFGISYERFKRYRDEFFQLIRDRVVAKHPEYSRHMERGRAEQEKRIEERRQEVSEYGKHTERGDVIWGKLSSDPGLKKDFEEYLDGLTKLPGTRAIKSPRIKKLWGIWLSGKGLGVGAEGFAEIQRELGDLAYPQGNIQTYRGDKSKYWSGQFKKFMESRKEKQAHIPYSVIN